MLVSWQARGYSAGGGEENESWAGEKFTRGGGEAVDFMGNFPVIIVPIQIRQFFLRGNISRIGS